MLLKTLKETINLGEDGDNLTIEAGTIIQVDDDNMIGHYQGYHFDVVDDDFE